MSILGFVGKRALLKWRSIATVTAVICEVLWAALHRRCWPRTVRELLVKQILFTAVDASGLVVLVAILSGISIVTQANVWLSRFGQSAMLGSVLVAVIIREIGPLLVNFIIIGRSGTAVATELASMKVRREINVLDAQGVDPLIYLVMPRVIGITISVICLAVIFSVVSLASGYFVSLAMDVTKGDYSQFTGNVLGAISKRDVANFLAKTLVPGLVSGVICCVTGLEVHGSVTEVPQAATRGVVKSISAVLVVSAVVSILTYI